MLLKNRLFKNLGSIGHLGKLRKRRKNSCPRTTPRGHISLLCIEKREHTATLGVDCSPMSTQPAMSGL